jgi:hypothetical protein
MTDAKLWRGGLWVLVVLGAMVAWSGCEEAPEEEDAANNHANNHSHNSENNGGVNNGGVNNGGVNNGGVNNGGANNHGANNHGAEASAYSFESRYTPGESSVAYKGQVKRLVLIKNLANEMKGLGAKIDAGTYLPAQDGEVVALFDFYFRFDGATSDAEPLNFATTPAPSQATYGDLDAGKSLVEKIAGVEADADSKDWATAFGGWSDEGLAASGGSISNPEGFVVALFETVEDHALKAANGELRTGPNGVNLPPHFSDQGVDLSQITEKFLWGAVALSQASDDYLDDNLDAKGLNAPNTRDGEKAWTSLEHAWDEGFGYFGASRDAGGRTDQEIADAPSFDADGDGAIDLTSEHNFSMMGYAVKRDLASDAAAPTDYSARIFGAFVKGRSIIANAGDALTDDQKAALRQERDEAIGAWEELLAANIVHYLNRTLGHMEVYGGDGYDALEHGKVWSEAKGFALCFQFNPRSRLSSSDFAELHALLGDAPVFAAPDAPEALAYRTKLLGARALLGDRYGFDEANLGDEKGVGGW